MCDDSGDMGFIMDHDGDAMIFSSPCDGARQAMSETVRIVMIGHAATEKGECKAAVGVHLDVEGLHRLMEMANAALNAHFAFTGKLN